MVSTKHRAEPSRPESPLPSRLHRGWERRARLQPWRSRGRRGLKRSGVVLGKLRKAPQPPAPSLSHGDHKSDLVVLFQ